LSPSGATQSGIETAGLTDLGLVRSNNEDSLFFVDGDMPEAPGARAFGIYLIADGMGGHQGGEIASRIAMRSISNALLEGLRNASGPVSAPAILKEALEIAHSEILSEARNNTRLRTMGTTATVGLRLGCDLHLGHVGDSRAYLVREGRIRQLTDDHSVVGQLIKQGDITSQQGRTHPERGVLLRCLGVSRNVTVDTSIKGTQDNVLALRSGDALVFCSDGLTDSVSDGEILRSVVTRPHPADACKDLIDKANSRGGLDNTTVIVVKVPYPPSVRSASGLTSSPS